MWLIGIDPLRGWSGPLPRPKPKYDGRKTGHTLKQTHGSGGNVWVSHTQDVLLCITVGGWSKPMVVVASSASSRVGGGGR